MFFDKFKLNNKIALITGGAKGIGLSIAHALGEAGAKLVLIDRENSTGGIEELSKANYDVTFFEGDLLDRSVPQKTIDFTLEKHGRIDILVNNAAPPYGEDRVPVVEVENEVFKKVFMVKIYGSFLCSKAVAKVMIAQGDGGRIINLSSSAGKEGNARMAAYNAANFGLEGFSQSLAKELAEEQITVNCVCPGQTETARLDPLGRGAIWKSRIESIPMGRVGTDEEVADLIAFLASDKARFITGQAININGGSITSR